MRAGLALFGAWADPYVHAVAAANGLTITGQDFRLKVDDAGPLAGGRRAWVVYPKVVLDLDGVVDFRHPYFDPYWDDFETEIRSLVAAAPPGRDFLVSVFHDAGP